MSGNKKPAMCPMVGWYDPRQLARTAVEVAVSTIFGRHADYRITEALVPPDENDDVFGFVVLRDASTNQCPLLRRRQGCGRKGFEQGSGFQRTSWTSRIYFERSDIQKTLAE